MVKVPRQVRFNVSPAASCQKVWDSEEEWDFVCQRFIVVL